LALRDLGTARTGAYFSVAPFTRRGGIALIAARESDALVLVAGALMAAGIWLHLTERHEHDHLHEEIMHEHSHVHDEHHRHEHDFPWDGVEPHTHPHRYEKLRHTHAHYPDIHHRHGHAKGQVQLQAAQFLLPANSGFQDGRPACGKRHLSLQP
jgi:hypothetical protein